MGNGVQAEWGSGCFGTGFCFQGRERRLEQIRAEMAGEIVMGGASVWGCFGYRGEGA